MDDKIKLTVQKIKLLAEQNSEFSQEMQKLFGKTDSASCVFMNSNIPSDIEAIRSALEIRANASITYNDIKDQMVRNQLIIDNLRMENAALNLHDSEKDRFYIFCVNAFYQVENILNYFYHTVFPEIESLLKEIEDATKNETYKFKRNGEEDNVSSVAVAYKISAFCNNYMPEESNLKKFLGTLRKVRNEGAHRCDIIRQEKDENNYLYRFFKYNNFVTVRNNLNKLVLAVEDKLNNLNKEEKVESVIKSKLPSACFVLFGDESKKLPDNLLAKVKNLNNGDKIILTIIGNRIIDVSEP